MKEFFRDFDFYGTKLNFKLQNRQKYNTLCGGIISLVSLIIFIAFFFFHLKQEIQRKFPIGFESSFLQENNNYINNTNMTILWQIVQKNGDTFNYEENLTNFSVSTSIIYYDLNNKSTILNSQTCEDNIYFKDKAKYYCINLNSTEYNLTNWKLNMRYLELKINVNNEENNKILLNDIYIQFLFTNIYFNPLNYTDIFLVKFKKELFKVNTKHHNSIYNIKYKEYMSIDNKGWFFDKYNLNSIFGLYNIEINNNNENENINTLINSENLFKIYLDEIVYIYFRNYTKIFAIILEPLILSFILFKIIQQIFDFINISLLTKYIINFLFIQKSSNFKISNFNLSKPKFLSHDLEDNSLQKLNLNNINVKKKISLNKINKNFDVSTSMLINKKQNIPNTNLPPINENSIFASAKHNSKQLFLIEDNKKCINTSQSPDLSRIKNVSIKPSNKFTELKHQEKFANLEKSSDIILNKSFHGINLGEIAEKKVEQSYNKNLFPIYYYFLINMFCLKNKKIFNQKFKSVYIFINRVLNFETYIISIKEFNLLKNQLRPGNKEKIESPKKLDINKIEYKMRNFNENTNLSVIF